MPNLPVPLIYVNPRTPSEMRAVLADINRNLNALITEIISQGFDTITAASAISAGDFVYIDASGELDIAVASAYSTSLAIGVAVAGISAGSTGEIKTTGIVEKSGWGLTPGATYFLSAVAPGAIVTEPDITSAGAVAKVVGRALSATELFVDIEPGVVYA